jgi:hypothetical protein
MTDTRGAHWRHDRAIATAQVIADSRAADGASPVRDRERRHPGCDGAAHRGVAGAGRDGLREIVTGRDLCLPSPAVL